MPDARFSFRHEVGVRPLAPRRRARLDSRKSRVAAATVPTIRDLSLNHAARHAKTQSASTGGALLEMSLALVIPNLLEPMQAYAATKGLSHDRASLSAAGNLQTEVCSRPSWTRKRPRTHRASGPLWGLRPAPQRAVLAGANRLLLLESLRPLLISPQCDVALLGKLAGALAVCTT